MRVGDESSSPRTTETRRAKTSDATTTPKVTKKSSPESQPVAKEKTPTSTPAKALDRKSDGVPSNPAASRDLVRRQSSTAASLTSRPSSFGAVSGPVRKASSGQDGKKGDQAHLVDNPLEEEQRTDVKTPKPFRVGSPQPKLPTFEGQKPSHKEVSETGRKVETFEKDGVTYTRTSYKGEVTTSYTQDGVDYSGKVNKDGTSEVELEQRTGDGVQSRTIEYNAKGKVKTDSSHSSEIYGPKDYQVRKVTLGANGVRTVEETVSRPDGGLATLNRTKQPDGRVKEVYKYKGDQGTVNRTTDQATDGTSETRTERGYRVDSPLEDVLADQGVRQPKLPGAAKGRVADLPSGQREETVVREVEVSTSNAKGKEKLEYSEETYSQTSTDVDYEPSTYFPIDGLENADGSVTRTITKARARDEDGKLVESTGASQSVTLKGRRSDKHGGGELSVTGTESWNGKGESSSTFATDGFQGIDHGRDLSKSPDSAFKVSIGGQKKQLKLPDGKVNPRGAYLKGAPDWLSGASGQKEGREYDPLDYSVTINRDAKGKTTSENVTVSETDEKGNGRTITGTEAGGQISWTYANYSNDGQNYKKQTVFEGTDLSVYERHEVTGPGQFKTSSETRDGDKKIATSDTSRQKVSEQALRQYVQDGQLTDAQLSRMLRDGPPYYMERHSEHAEPWKDKDGNLHEGKDRKGKAYPLQPGHDIESFTVKNERGYAVSETYHQQFDKDGNAKDSRLKTVTDPKDDPPISGRVTQRERTSSGGYRVTGSSEIQVDAKGKLTYDGKEVGKFDFADGDFRKMLEDDELGAKDILGFVAGVAQAGQDAPRLSRFAGGRFSLTGEAGNLAKVSRVSDIFGVYSGTQSLFSGIGKGDGRAVVEGLGDIAGGLNSLAAATSAWGGSTRVGTTASRFSTLSEGSTVLGKFLGGAGGAIGLGFGLYDTFTADTTRGKVSGGLSAAAGAVALGSAWFGPPGWVFGGLISGGLTIASVLVGQEDQRRTADIDERLY